MNIYHVIVYIHLIINLYLITYVLCYNKTLQFKNQCYYDIIFTSIVFIGKIYKVVFLYHTNKHILKQ